MLDNYCYNEFISKILLSYLFFRIITQVMLGGLASVAICFILIAITLIFYNCAAAVMNVTAKCLQINCLSQLPHVRKRSIKIPMKDSFIAHAYTNICNHGPPQIPVFFHFHLSFLFLFCYLFTRTC